jgi:hypothetical protein
MDDLPWSHTIGLIFIDKAPYGIHVARIIESAA